VVKAGSLVFAWARLSSKIYSKIFAMGKHSSLFCANVCDEENKFDEIVTSMKDERMRKNNPKVDDSESCLSRLGSGNLESIP
jgi:hypothetical protein